MYTIILIFSVIPVTMYTIILIFSVIPVTMYTKMNGRRRIVCRPDPTTLFACEVSFQTEYFTPVIFHNSSGKNTTLIAEFPSFS